MCHQIENNKKELYDHFYLSSLLYGDWMAGLKQFGVYGGRLCPLIQSTDVIYYEQNGFVTCKSPACLQQVIFSFNTMAKNVENNKYLRTKRHQLSAGMHISPFGKLKNPSEDDLIVLPGMFGLKRQIKNQKKFDHSDQVFMVMFRISDILFYDGEYVSVEQFVPIKFPKEITVPSLLNHFEKQLERRENGKPVVDPRFLQK